MKGREVICLVSDEDHGIREECVGGGGGAVVQ